MSADVIKQMSTPDPVATRATEEKPVLLEAINLTLRTIERRAWQYRNLVIAVSLTTFVPVILAVLLRRWVVLVGWLALPFYVSGFVLLDQQVVKTWRRGVLQMRAERGLSVTQLEQTLMGFRHLPQATLRSMLAVLTSEEPKI